MSGGKAGIDLLSKSRRIENIATQGPRTVSHSVSVQISPSEARLMSVTSCFLPHGAAGRKFAMHKHTMTKCRA